MSRRHQDREEEDLLAYFKQMLSTDEYLIDDEPQQQTVNTVASVSAAAQVQTQTQEPQMVYAQVDNIPKQDNYELQPKLQTQSEVKVKAEIPYAKGKSLESLLQAIDTAEVKEEQTTVTSVVTEAKPQLSLLQKQAQLASAIAQAEAKPQKTQAVVEQKTEQKEQVIVKTEQKVEETQSSQAVDNSPLGENWQNIDLGDCFQTLFFTVQGVRFAVPLIWLGGIFQYDKSSKLFGKPAWYMGMTDIRGNKINIVDTFRFVKPDVGESPDKYDYIIKLGQSNWSLGCDVLEGNRTLTKEQVKWRVNVGNRPYLAGIVKDDKCALLHVDALIAIFNKKNPDNEDKNIQAKE